MDLLDLIITFYQISGISQLSLFKSKIITALLNLNTLYSIILITALIIYTTFNPLDFYYLADAVGSLTDISQTCCPFIGHYVIIMRAYLGRKNLKKLWNKIAEADLILNEFYIDTRALNHEISSKYLILWCIAQFISFSSEIRIIWGIRVNRVWSNQRYFILFSTLITRCEYLFYLLFVDLLKGRLICLNDQLINLSKSHTRASKQIQNKTTKDETIFKILKLKKLYGILWYISFKMNDCFGWSQLANVGVNFLSLTSNCYWIYSTLYYKANVFGTESILCAVSPVTISLVFFYGCENCLSVIKSVGFNLHKIRQNRIYKCRSFSTTLHQFSLQIINQRIEFDIKGFFKMNYDLLKGVSIYINNVSI